MSFVTPEEVLGPVSPLEDISMGSDALYLHCTPPEEPNGNSVGYRILYEIVTGTQLRTRLKRQPRIEDPLATNAKLAGLTPATKYRVRIHPYTVTGLVEGFYIELSTKAEDAAGYPDQPAFDWYHRKASDGTDELKIQWDPTSGNGKKPGSYFYVQYRLKGSETFLSTPKDENQDDYCHHQRFRRRLD